MLAEFFAASLSLFVLDPLKSELHDRIGPLAANAQNATVVRDCVSTVVPHLLQKAEADYWWAASTIVSVGTGFSEPASLLAYGPQSCQTAFSIMNSSGAGASE